VLIVFIAAYVLAAVYAVPYGASRLLTVGYHRFTAEGVDQAQAGPGDVAVVVLGSGDEVVDGWEDQLIVTTTVEGARVLEAARVFRLIAPAWVIASGGDPLGTGPPSSITMRDELMRLGVPDVRILLESRPRDTHEEAIRIAPMLRSLGVRQLVLVTSESHMRRALGTFRAVGWNAVPAIAPGPRHPAHRFEWILPTRRGLDFSGAVIHEAIGIPYYAIRGWWR
jgi:uncharacterized SAM-binding protein YcdF (DUF218 family)